MIHELENIPDVIVCTETRQIDENLFQIPGYSIHYNRGNLNQNDGVVTYVKQTLMDEHQIEYIGTTAVNINKIKKNNTDYEIFSIYKSPTIKIPEFIDHLEIFLNSKSAHSTTEKVLIGDLNIDLMEDTITTNGYLNVLAAYGYISTIKIPTRITETTSTCIDHCFIKSNRSTENWIAAVIENNITDHFPIAIKIPTAGKKREENMPDKQITINYRKLRNNMAKKDLWSMYLCHDVDYCTTLLTSTIQEAVRESQTEKKISQRNKQPWITTKLIKSIARRDKLRKIANKTKNPIHQEIFRRFRNQLTTEIKKARYDYFTRRLGNNNTDQKNIWNVVNDFLPRKANKRALNEELKKGDGTKTENAQDRANYFNYFFANVGKNLAKKFKNKQYHQDHIERIADTLYLHPVSETEIYKEIMSLKDGKSPGYDRITTKCLKSIADLIVEPLTHIVNTAFGTGVFPRIYKKAVIKAIYKAGKKDEVGNYRPISLISNLAKIVEKCLYRRIIRFINEHNIISNKQFGFRQNKSTEDALKEFTETIYENIDKKMPTLSIFVDLAKAFDTLDHNILLKKLERLGIRGISHSLITSYLEEREQSVNIEEITSEVKIMEYGVPQGTVIGPLLFILYINDLYKLQTPGKIFSFADDTSIIFEETNWEKLQTLATNEMPKIYEWFSRNSLTINVEKTNVILHGSLKTSLPKWEHITFRYQEESKILKITDNTKYLGVIIDSHLRWDKHVTWLCKKLRYLPFIFRKLKNILQEKILATCIYHALFYSILRYGILVWGGTNKNNIRQVEIIQKRVLKVINNKPPTYPSEMLYKEAEQLNLKETFGLQAIINICRKGINIGCNQTEQKHTRQTEKQLLRIPAKRKAIGQRTSDFIGIRLINNMPTTLRRKLMNYSNSKKKAITSEIVQWFKNINIENVLKIEL